MAGHQPRQVGMQRGQPVRRQARREVAQLVGVAGAGRRTRARRRRTRRRGSGRSASPHTSAGSRWPGSGGRGRAASSGAVVLDQHRVAPVRRCPRHAAAARGCGRRSAGGAPASAANVWPGRCSGQRVASTAGRHPGPATTSGTWMSVSNAVSLPGVSRYSPDVEAVVGAEHDVGVAGQRRARASARSICRSSRRPPAPIAPACGTPGRSARSARRSAARGSPATRGGLVGQRVELRRSAAPGGPGSRGASRGAGV